MTEAEGKGRKENSMTRDKTKQSQWTWAGEREFKNDSILWALVVWGLWLG